MRLLTGAFPPRAYAISGPYAPASVTRLLTQTHCHTTGSDGSYSAATVVGHYLGAGYDVLAITDHDVVTAQPAGIGVTIVGNELSPSTQHIISLNSSYTRGAGTVAQDLVDGVLAAGGQCHVAHPNWTIGMTYAELAALTGHMGIEIHNATVVTGAGGADPVAYPGYALELWDQLLAAGYRSTWGFALDDLHVIDAFDAHDVGRLHVFASTASAAAVMAAMAAGNFAADVSNHGVTPGYPVRTAADLSVTCSGAARIEAWGDDGLLETASGESLTHTFDGTQTYVRLVAVGSYAEDFASALSDRWYALDGSWSATGGVCALGGATGDARRLILRRHRQGDFTAQVDVKLGAGDPSAGALLFNVLDANRYYMLRIGESSVAGYDDALTVSKTTNNSFAANSQLDAHAITATEGTWYTLKMAHTRATGTIAAKVWDRDGEAEPGAWQVEVADTTWGFGAFAFRGNYGVQFDNLAITGFETFYQPVSVDVR